MFQELWSFENLSARYLEKYLSKGLDTWADERGWRVDYLVNFLKYSVKIFRSFGPLQIMAF